MENLYAVCCGIDVHKKLIVACLRQEQNTQIKEFGASTRELLSLADWLLENHCQAVAMEIRENKDLLRVANPEKRIF